MNSAPRRRVVVVPSSDEIESASPLVGINSVPETFIRRFAFARERSARTCAENHSPLRRFAAKTPGKRTLMFSGGVIEFEGK